MHKILPAHRREAAKFINRIITEANGYYCYKYKWPVVKNEMIRASSVVLAQGAMLVVRKTGNGHAMYGVRFKNKKKKEGL